MLINALFEAGLTAELSGCLKEASINDVRSQEGWPTGRLHSSPNWGQGMGLTIDPNFADVIDGWSLSTCYHLYLEISFTKLLLFFQMKPGTMTAAATLEIIPVAALPRPRRPRRPRRHRRRRHRERRSRRTRRRQTAARTLVRITTSHRQVTAICSRYGRFTVARESNHDSLI